MPACTLRLLLAGAVRNEGKKPVIRAEAGQGWVSQAVLSRADRCVTIGVRLKQMPAISHDCMTFRQTFCVFVILRRPGKQLKAHEIDEHCCLCVHNRLDDKRTFVRIPFNLRSCDACRHPLSRLFLIAAMLQRRVRKPCSSLRLRARVGIRIIGFLGTLGIETKVDLWAEERRAAGTCCVGRPP